MLIDSNLVSIDCKPIAAITGDAVDLANLKMPGRHDVPVCVKVLETAEGGTSVTVKIQQGDTATGSFAEVASKTVLLADLKRAPTSAGRLSPRKSPSPGSRSRPLCPAASLAARSLPRSSVKRSSHTSEASTSMAASSRRK